MKYIIEVKRRRSSVTQGSAHVLVNGIEVADFYDEIKLLKKGEEHFGRRLPSHRQGQAALYRQKRKDILDVFNARRGSAARIVFQSGGVLF